MEVDRQKGPNAATTATTRRVRCALATRRIGAITSESPSSSTVFSKLNVKPRYRHYRAAILCLNWEIILDRLLFNADTGDRVFLIRHNRGEVDGATEGLPDRALSGMQAPRTGTD